MMLDVGALTADGSRVALTLWDDLTEEVVRGPGARQIDEQYDGDVVEKALCDLRYAHKEHREQRLHLCLAWAIQHLAAFTTTVGAPPRILPGQLQHLGVNTTTIICAEAHDGHGPQSERRAFITAKYLAGRLFYKYNFGLMESVSEACVAVANLSALALNDLTAMYERGWLAVLGADDTLYAGPHAGLQLTEQSAFVFAHKDLAITWLSDPRASHFTMEGLAAAAAAPVTPAPAPAPAPAPEPATNPQAQPKRKGVVHPTRILPRERKVPKHLADYVDGGRKPYMP
ncbi:MAG: hypothetical protein CMP58_03630 [Flavobacteriales bacterium]|nr:hypothetical protein [Flavobacteriales bacterium]